MTSQNIVYAAVDLYQGNQQDTTENELEYATVQPIVVTHSNNDLTNDADTMNVEEKLYEQIEDNVGYELDDLVTNQAYGRSIN